MARSNPAAGRCVLHLGSVDALPDFGEPFDAIYAVNSVGFWPDLLARLAELRGRYAPTRAAGGHRSLDTDSRNRVSQSH